MDNQNTKNQPFNEASSIGRQNLNQSVEQTQVEDNLSSQKVTTFNSTVSKEKNKNKYLKKISELWLKLNPALRKIIIITGFIFCFILLIGLVFSFSSKRGSKIKTTPKPTSNIEMSPLPEIIINPSKYATDSGVLIIEENLKNIEKEIGTTLINDLKLAPPNFLWDINFED